MIGGDRESGGGRKELEEIGCRGEEFVCYGSGFREEMFVWFDLFFFYYFVCWVECGLGYSLEVGGKVKLRDIVIWIKVILWYLEVFRVGCILEKNK